MHWRLHLEREEENKENIPWKITLPMTPYKRNLVWFFGPEVPVFCHGVTDLIITMAAEGRLATNNKHPLFTRCDTLLPTSIHTLQLILFGGLPLPLPTSLTQLELAHTDHKFLPGQLPSNLRLLSLRDYEYRTILPGVLPHSLETLIVCGQEHAHIRGDFINHLPPNLQELHTGVSAYNDIFDDERAVSWPKHLKKLSLLFPCESWMHLVELMCNQLPSTLESLVTPAALYVTKFDANMLPNLTELTCVGFVGAAATEMSRHIYPKLKQWRLLRPWVERYPVLSSDLFPSGQFSHIVRLTLPPECIPFFSCGALPSTLRYLAIGSKRDVHRSKAAEYVQHSHYNIGWLPLHLVKLRIAIFNQSISTLVNIPTTLEVLSLPACKATRVELTSLPPRLHKLRLAGSHSVFENGVFENGVEDPAQWTIWTKNTNSCCECWRQPTCSRGIVVYHWKSCIHTQKHEQREPRFHFPTRDFIHQLGWE